MPEPKWAAYEDEKLLKVRIKDLGLKIEGTELESCVTELHKEMQEKGLTFLPECYLADEWLCPDEEPIIGIPFYLAHSRLKKLEKKMVLEVEGGTREECMRLLRHEAGHAINYAYRLFRRKKWKEVFGDFNDDYPETYVPRPYSKKFVRHIENCYAQYHPDEDFAETFAVWLTPGKDWKVDYKKWKVALAKLEYVDFEMKRIFGKKPLVEKPKRYWDASKLTKTLDFYYRKKRREYAEHLPGFYDPDMKKVFKETAGEPQEKADQFIKRYRRRIVSSVSLWTGKNRYLINKIVKDLLDTCRELGLQRYRSEEETLLEITTYINTMVMNYLFTGRLKECP